MNQSKAMKVKKSVTTLVTTQLIQTMQFRL
jgi:hypothetical protein